MRGWEASLAGQNVEGGDPVGYVRCFLFFFFFGGGVDKTKQEHKDEDGQLSNCNFPACATLQTWEQREQQQ